MDTAEATGVEMPKEGVKKKKKKHFSHCEFKRRRAQPTDADQQREGEKKQERRRMYAEWQHRCGYSDLQ